MNINNFKITNPILDQRELALLDNLTNEYKDFIAPKKIGKLLQSAQSRIGAIIPTKAKLKIDNAVKAASEWDMIQKALEHTGKGFLILQAQASKLTLNKNNIINTLKSKKDDLTEYEQICALRSYDIAKVVGKQNYKDLLAAFGEGFICGAPGIVGVPFNIALSFLLYFRAVQSIALYYGYDVKDNPSELEFAATVTISSLCPNSEQSSETLAGLIGKMMLSANLTALKSSLNKTYTEMAKKGGAELLYVQIRALANKAAEKALKNAGKNGIEAGIYKNLLEEIGKRLSKEAGKKAIPILGAFIGGASDTYYMNRVLKGANLIYHKRFLFEKEQRVNLLIGDSDFKELG